MRGRAVEEQGEEHERSGRSSWVKDTEGEQGERYLERGSH